jgi:hypothetical protein
VRSDQRDIPLNDNFVTIAPPEPETRLRQVQVVRLENWFSKGMRHRYAFRIGGPAANGEFDEIAVEPPREVAEQRDVIAHIMTSRRKV